MKRLPIDLRNAFALLRAPAKPGLAVMVLFLATPVLAAPKQNEQTAEQKEADRHFKSGVALYKESKYAEALAEFERAYELVPHPLVLYNIATCHRELSHYGEAVKYYQRFLKEGADKVPAARLKEAQSELDAVLQRIARVTVTIKGGEGAKIILDGEDVGTMPIDGPLIVPPGEHRLVVRAEGKQDAERAIRVASGDEVQVTLQLTDAPKTGLVESLPPPPPPPPKPKRFALGAAVGTNLLNVPETGAPTLGVGFKVHPHMMVGVDATLVAYAAMPNVRVRLAGDQLSVHATVAIPIAFNDGNMSETFVAGAAGVGVRYRATPALAFRLEGFASYGFSDHGFTLPAFFGGELWF
ncbi:MAG TPA: PEGA domain-containing protein [Kofleriaceae bacterium]|nr:PEGA domain-containing protein [Kofleriaceae bacterium]